MRHVLQRGGCALRVTRDLGQSGTGRHTHFASVAHPTSPVGAALLALAERQPVTGKQLVLALVLGNEIQCRVGNIVCTPPAECAIGLSMAGLVGCIGVAVATGVVMGFDEDTMATAIGLAANQSAGLREAHATMGGQSAGAGGSARSSARRGDVEEIAHDHFQ